MGRGGDRARDRPDRVPRAKRAAGCSQPLAQLEAAPLSLDPAHLPEYAARTTLRMLAALALSLLFTLTYATWAAKSERAGKLLVPILDILQSVPILGFISITVVFFMSLGAGPRAGRRARRDLRDLHQPGLEHGVQLLPVAAHRADRAHARPRDSFQLSPWMRFWQLEVPFAMPALIWNMMMSMSGGWFFVVAAEAISVGNTTVDAAGHRLVHRARDRAAQPRGDRLGDRRRCSS